MVDGAYKKGNKKNLKQSAGIGLVGVTNGFKVLEGGKTIFTSSAPQAEAYVMVKGIIEASSIELLPSELLLIRENSCSRF